MSTASGTPWTGHYPGNENNNNMSVIFPLQLITDLLYFREWSLITRFGPRQDSGIEVAINAEVKCDNGAILGYTLRPYTQ